MTELDALEQLGDSASYRAARRNFIDRAAIAQLPHVPGNGLVAEWLQRELAAKEAYAAASALWKERERRIKEGKL